MRYPRRMLVRGRALCAVIAVTAFAATASADDAPAPACNLDLGRQIYALCSACHALNATEPPREGPLLRGAYGRRAGADPKFKYSPALLASNLVWDDATLDRFITNPRRAIPGTIMTFIGLKLADERSAVVCYLREQR